MGLIESRRSVRAYTKTAVPDGVLKQIIGASHAAPSPKNRRPWYFVVVNDIEKIEDIAQLMERYILKLLQEKPDRRDITMALDTIAVIRQAPTLIFVCYRYGTVPIHDDGVNWPFNASDIEAVELQSIGAAVQNMLLKARELGLDSLWCADILYAYGDISRCISPPYPIISAICLGYAASAPKPRDDSGIDSFYEFL